MFQGDSASKVLSNICFLLCYSCAQYVQCVCSSPCSAVVHVIKIWIYAPIIFVSTPRHQRYGNVLAVRLYWESLKLSSSNQFCYQKVQTWMEQSSEVTQTEFYSKCRWSRSFGEHFECIWSSPENILECFL